MWYWLRQLESLLFYLPFLIYASLRHLPYSIRCRNCGRWLFRRELCWSGFCERCAGEESKRGAQQFYDDSYGKRIATNVTSLCEHLHGGIPKRIGSGKILEVGCGTGYLLSKLQSLHRQLYGIDTSPMAVKTTQAHATGACVCAADARSLPFKSDSFDWLICLEVLEHIEGAGAIKECFRVLKPGGKALFSVPNAKGVGGRMEGHVRFFTFASFLEYVRLPGFELLSARKIGLLIPILTYTCRMLSLATNKNIPLNHPLNVSLPEFLAVNFLIECRKPAK